MKRSDPRALTLFLAFLVVYLLVTGSLVLFLRAIVVEERAERLATLEQRSAVLEETVRIRALQEREIVAELISVAGARDFEDAYAQIRNDIEELKQRFAEVEGLATEERQRRLISDRERSDVISRVRALELTRDRLVANRDACLLNLAMCSENRCP